MWREVCGRGVGLEVGVEKYLKQKENSHRTMSDQKLMPPDQLLKLILSPGPSHGDWFARLAEIVNNLRISIIM